MRVAIDADSIAFAAASVCETRAILATHIKTGKTKEFPNKTALFGTKNKPGYLTEINKDREVPFTAEDFEIKEVQALKEGADLGGILRGMVGRILNRCGYEELRDTYICYLGSGETFRHEAATLIQYKGNRENVIKPLKLREARQYILDYLNGELVEEIEADDAVQMEGVRGYVEWQESGNDDDRIIVVSIDKDAKRGPGWLMNPDKDTAPRLIEGFGKLEVVQKTSAKAVDGYGRIFGYWQVAYGDPVDNYFAHSASTVKWGPMKAYEALKDCKDDKEALEALIGVYKYLYPEPRVVRGWRGDEIKIDWLYVLRENYRMATMKVGERLPDILWIMQKYGVKYD